MSKRPKAPARPTPDKVLRDAFRAVEAQPVPEALTDLVNRLADGVRRPDRRA